MPNLIILPSIEALDMIRFSGDRCWGRGQYAAKIMLITPPTRTIAPTVPEMIILSTIETVKVIRPKGSNRWSGGQDTAKIFLIAPVRAVPPAMFEVVI